MAKKKASQQDLKRMMRLLSEVADIQVRYMELGSTPKEIAETFTDCYIRQFEKALTTKATKSMPRNSYFESPPSISKVAISYCFNLSCEMVKAVGKLMRKEE